MTLQTISIPSGIQTDTFVLGKGVLDSLPELIATRFPGRTPWIVADETTWNVAGKRSYDLLEKAGLAPAKPHIFPAIPRLHPDYNYSKQLAAEMPANAAPIAVGSGVINDLVKCAAGIAEVHYCCVPTACSVDGYTSAGGAMSVDGLKMTVPCPAPFALCADTDILATAPAPMFASGYADLLTKIPAGADWIIADALKEEVIVPSVWSLVQDKIRLWTSDATNMGNVFDGLAHTGYSMQVYSGSRPASGCEHLFSHVWEMEGLQYNGEDVSHGFKVGVGSLISTVLLEYVVNHSFEELEPKMQRPQTRAEREADVNQLLIRGCYGSSVVSTAMSKFLEGDAIVARRAEIKRLWKHMQDGIKKQIMTYTELKGVLANANCPVTPAEIGLDKEQFFHGIRTAQLIRVRYTVIDLLYELGLFDDALKHLESVMYA